MSSTEYTIVYEQGPTSWGAYVKNLPGCYAVGDTREECERLIKEAIPLHLDARQRQVERLGRGRSSKRKAARRPPARTP